jgi:hypothetical protein
MNFLTTAFGVLFMVGFLYGAGQAMREDSAAKLARHKRISSDASKSANEASSDVERAQQAAAGVGVPGTTRRAKVPIRAWGPTEPGGAYE